MARKASQISDIDINSQSNSLDEDMFCVSVTHFSSIFPNLDLSVKTHGTKTTEKYQSTKPKARKLKEKDSNVTTTTSKSQVSKKESREEKLEKIRRAKEATRNIDDLRLLDDVDDVLNLKTSEPVLEVTPVVILAPEVEVPTKKAKVSKRNTRAKKKGKKSIPNIPIEFVIEEEFLLDDDVEEVEIVDKDATQFVAFQVSWKDNTFTYRMDLNSKVSKLRQRIIDSTQTRAEDILIYLRDDILTDDKTLLECGVKSSDILEVMPAGNSEHANLDPAMLKLKCQTQKRREVFFIHLRKSSSFRQLRMDIAEKMKLAPEEVKLQFDGDTLDLDDTPESVGLEDGECIDVFT